MGSPPNRRRHSSELISATGAPAGSSSCGKNPHPSAGSTPRTCRKLAETVSKQLEIHFDMGRHGHRDAVLRTRPETPPLDGGYCAFIQTQSDTFYDSNVLGCSIGINFHVK